MQENQDIIRVAHIIGKWVGGGVEAVVMNYYRHINRSKIQFDFICDEDSTNIPYDEIEKLGGKVILIPPYQKLISYHKRLKQILKEGQYKIVHSHINTLSVFSLFAAKCAGVPVRIAHSHSTTNKKEKKKNLIKQVLRPFSKIFATDYMCCSELAGRWLFGNKEYDKGNVYLLNNAIDLDKFKYDEVIRKEKRKELNIDDDTIVIGHVGRFVEQKNHRFLIDIFNEVHKQNEKSILLLVGQGPLMEEIKEKVKSLGIEDCVKFLGQRNDISELYQAMDLFLFPSLYEGLGMVLIEAQTEGLSCIASTEVPYKAKVLENFKFIELTSDKKKWVKTVMECNYYAKRKSCIDAMSEAGYSIKYKAKGLEEKYLDLIKKNEKIRVCHVICGLKSGGVETVIYNYCKEIGNEEFEWFVLYQHEPAQKNVEEFEKIGVKLYRIPSKIKHPIKNYKETKKYLKKEKIDIVHCHMTLMNFIPLIAAKKNGIKTRICHSHNSDTRDKNILIRVIEQILKKISIENATQLVACGNDAGKYMFGKRKFIVLYNSMDLRKFMFDSNIRKSEREKMGIDDSTIVLGNIGRFTKQKNHVFLLEVFKKILLEEKNVKLVLVGDGEQRENIEILAQEMGIYKNIIFTGVISNTNYMYSLFDIFLLPSLWEGLPVVAIEAQAAGLRCFFSNTIDSDSVIDEKSAKLLELDTELWKNEVLKVLNFTNESNRKININKFIEKNLDITNEAKKLKEIYKENI